MTMTFWHMPSFTSSRALRLRLLGVAVALSITAVGCFPWGRGTYQVEIFSEMHYSQSYRSQEPPRLYTPEGAVPFALVGQGTLTVPASVILSSTSESVALGEKLYGVNCAFCHGDSGVGDGPMRGFLTKYGGIPPADITSSTSISASDQDLLAFVAEGGRTGLFTSQAGVESPSTMPAFKKLLPVEEQWAVVHYLRQLQGQ